MLFRIIWNLNNHGNTKIGILNKVHLDKDKENFWLIPYKFVFNTYIKKRRKKSFFDIASYICYKMLCFFLIYLTLKLLPLIVSLNLTSTSWWNSVLNRKTIVDKVWIMVLKWCWNKELKGIKWLCGRKGSRVSVKPAYGDLTLFPVDCFTCLKWNWMYSSIY